MPPEGSTRAEKLQGCPSLDRNSRHTGTRVRTKGLPISKFALTTDLSRAHIPGARKRMYSKTNEREYRRIVPLGRPGSIPALMLPSGGMAARHRKGATAERLHDRHPLTTFWEECSTLSVPNRHATKNENESWDTVRLPKPRQKSRGKRRVRTTDIPIKLTAFTFRCTSAMQPEGCTTAEILPGCPGLDRSN
ncbi:hypothetical protein T265_06079 [Opisthorchis viverrini]|uniref:Uncharacterized protein n=1 Tax=Opisthorchis viverrini TaxID=6198 RepID=A0A074ZLT9_OPIVI|nr:hypothetical protein T265_06079 [Opisthorchis viverrini]KER26717.1 hypothetical protein T265_06079 [Opisthorchis viverrini]